MRKWPGWISKTLNKFRVKRKNFEQDENDMKSQLAIALNKWR